MCPAFFRLKIDPEVLESEYWDVAGALAYNFRFQPSEIKDLRWTEMLEWLKSFKTPPKHIFIVHGETKSASAFADFIKDQADWKVTVPQYEQQVELN